jgi:predicted enzyme related to lactoylglutathione lyase
MPRFPHGKVSYMQIPAVDGVALALFYQKVFGWELPGDDNPNHRSFSDASGELIGAFDTEFEASADPGVLPFISVDNIDATVEVITREGGEIVKPVHDEGDLKVATFRDPQRNVIGIWWKPS